MDNPSGEVKSKRAGSLDAIHIIDGGDVACLGNWLMLSGDLIQSEVYLATCRLQFCPFRDTDRTSHQGKPPG